MIDRVTELEKLTKDYFIESHEFLFTKKFVNQRKRKINLIFSAYNLEYNLVLKDYKIFFDNKLKTRFKINTSLVRKMNRKRFVINKFSLISKKTRIDKFFSRNFNHKDITIRPNTLITFRVSRKHRDLVIRRVKAKRLTRMFFFRKAVEIFKSKKQPKI